jgi:hypothetical protein
MWSMACLTYGTAMGQHPETVIAMISDERLAEQNVLPAQARKRRWSALAAAVAWIARRIGRSDHSIVPDAALVPSDALQTGQ